MGNKRQRRRGTDAPDRARLRPSPYLVGNGLDLTVLVSTAGGEAQPAGTGKHLFHEQAAGPEVVEFARSKDDE